MFRSATPACPHSLVSKSVVCHMRHETRHFTACIMEQAEQLCMNTVPDVGLSTQICRTPHVYHACMSVLRCWHAHLRDDRLVDERSACRIEAVCSSSRFSERDRDNDRELRLYSANSGCRFSVLSAMACTGSQRSKSHHGPAHVSKIGQSRGYNMLISSMLYPAIM